MVLEAGVADTVMSGLGDRAGWSPTRALTRTIAVIAAALALCSAALLNGGPFIHPDTVGYTRGPDVAISKLFGPTFSTRWAKTNEGASAGATSQAAPNAVAQTTHDNEVLGGRSIYYGCLAYLGALTGGFWLTIFVQGLAVALLVEIMMRSLRILGLSTYAGVMALLTLATPAPFFVGFVMPDIWAGIAIGALSALFALSRRLTRTDVAVLAAMTAFSALAHNSVVPVLAAMILAGAGLWLIRRETMPRPLAGVAVGSMAIVVALAGAFAFSAMVKHAVGLPPLNPPFLTARVIADGPGTRLVREHCAGSPFAACRYASRLPLDADHFLWGATAKDGVFETVSGPERRALADQDARFALTAARTYPLDQIKASIRNAALQTIDADLSDFNYKPSLRAGFSTTLPPAVYASLQPTAAFRQAWLLEPLWILEVGVTLIALTAIAGAALRTPKAQGAPFEPREALMLAGMIILGVIANGVVCGVLSTLYGRYQARVEWLAPLAAILVILARARSRQASVRLR